MDSGKKKELNGERRPYDEDEENSFVTHTLRLAREAVNKTNEVKKKARESAERLNARAASYSRSTRTK